MPQAAPRDSCADDAQAAVSGGSSVPRRRAAGRRSSGARTTRPPAHRRLSRAPWRRTWGRRRTRPSCRRQDGQVGAAGVEARVAERARQDEDEPAAIGGPRRRSAQDVRVCRANVARGGEERRDRRRGRAARRRGRRRQSRSAPRPCCVAVDPASSRRSRPRSSLSHQCLRRSGQLPHDRRRGEERPTPDARAGRRPVALRTQSTYSLT